MKRFLILISVLVLVFAVAACNKKKKDKLADYEEQVSKEISAEEGGKVESSDGKTSIEIPGGALDEDTTITMTIYDASGYSDGNGKILSKVVSFEPNGTIFKKPVIISMTADEKVEGKTISAAVYDESKSEWSYSQGFYLILGDGKTEAGDPIVHTTDGKEVTLDNGNLTTAAGDPIMMTTAAGDPIMTNAAGDPIMMNAAGDPIMLASSNAAGDPIMTSAAGDPIMNSAAGDPIMNAAAGDPIMMTTGHFTAYTFIVFEPRNGEQEKPSEEPEKDEEVTDKDEEAVVEDDDIEISEEDDDIPDEDDDIDISDIEISDEDDDEDGDEEVIVPEPDPVYSKVVCTGQTKCSDGNSMIIDCPGKNEPLYGQDAQYVSQKSCVPREFEKLENIVVGGGDQEAELVCMQIHDVNTGLRWLLVPSAGLYESAKSFCEGENYGGMENWRLPTPKELLTILHSGTSYPSVRSAYFSFDSSNIILSERYWSEVSPALGKDSDNYAWGLDFGSGELDYFEKEGGYGFGITCVNGQEYGAVGEYTSQTIGNDEIVKDSSTNLIWQKTYESEKTWKDAVLFCESSNYAGYDDWRLPNRNELVSLIDYSNPDGNPASSFPDMPASENFWTSTFVPDYADTRGMFIVDTNLGRLLFSGDLERYLENGPLKASVRCVRSDIEPYQGTVPKCDKTGFTPCEAQDNKVWSQAFNSSSYLDIARKCRSSRDGGITQWRIPTIDELRTILSKSDVLKTGGTCGFNDSCNDISDPECYIEP